MRPSVILLLALLLGPGLMAAEPLPVFLLAGQSNMVGRRSLPEDLPPELHDPSPQVLIFDQQQGWQVLQAPRKPGYGPEISFGHAMAAGLGRTIGIIKVSKGGTNLAEEWHPAADNALYARLMEQLAAAREARPLVVSGFVWCHGGADAKDQAMSEAYAENLQALIAAVRRDGGNPQAAVVASRRNVNWIPENKPFLQLVRDAQEHCPAERYAWVDTDDLSFCADKIHFDGPGQVEAGRRYAKAMLALLQGP